MEEFNITDFILSANRALWCEIRPNMRKISFEYIKEEKRFVLYIYYDKPLTQEELDYDIPGTIIADISSDFPNEIDVVWDEEVIVLPYPERLPQKGRCVYRRYEHYPEDDFKQDSV